MSSFSNDRTMSEHGDGNSQRSQPAGEDQSSSEISAQRLVYFAAERTLLSWIRVALALMALGFVVDRFQLVLRTIQPAPGGAFQAAGGFAWIGASFVGLGVAATIVASIRYVRFHARYHRQHTTDPGPGLPWAIALTVAVAVIGTVIAVVLAVAGG